MATDATPRLRQAVTLGVVFLFLGPLLVQWGFAGADLLPTALVPSDLLPTVSSDLLVRLVGLALVVGVLGLLVRQKHSSRGQHSTDAAEEAADRKIEQNRRVEGSGETDPSYAYNNQQQARREGERIRDRGEEIAAVERDAARER
ncbi:hypothetical protein [Halorussus salinus]|uniref:hypothetical protein n=1 Tax=Halorussus salinus TaxID=1364935 RepID=UPI0010918A59|nr:hypothetical protein [Halorussus salinus]